MFTSLGSPPQLNGWSANMADPCGQSLTCVVCSGSSVTELKLSGPALNGNIGYQLANLASLKNLDISNNNLGVGGPIPYSLPPNVERLNLARNQFSGKIPYSVFQMTSIKYLMLHIYATKMVLFFAAHT